MIRARRFLHSALFQFHKGTIRTSYPSINTARKTKFQFHKGTIRTPQLVVTSTTACAFQFHKGTIRTLQVITFESQYFDKDFNSIKVQLELNFHRLLV